MLIVLLILLVAAGLFVLGGSSGAGSAGGSARGTADDDLDDLIGLDIVSDGQLDGHIGPRDEEW